MRPFQFVIDPWRSAAYALPAARIRTVHHLDDAPVLVQPSVPGSHDNDCSIDGPKLHLKPGDKRVTDSLAAIAPEP
jgi:hypothetical protein